jgi:VanZ family protein
VIMTTLNFSLSVVRILAWMLATAIVILSIVPPSLRPETGTPHAFEHIAIFFVTGLLFGIGYDRRHWLLGALLVVFSGTVELAQLLVPGRHARWSDFVIDALAISAGVAVTSLVRPIFTHRDA